MRVVVRVLTNEINHASPSNHPFLLEYIWTVISPETDDSVKLRRGGQTPFLFLQISSESRGSFSNEFRTGLVFFLFFFVLDGWSSFGTARLEICNNSRGGNEIIRYRVTGNNVDNMTSMSVVLLDSCAKQNGLCKLESKPWSGRTQFFTRNSIYPRGQILDQWLDQFIGIDLFSTNNSGARRRFKGSWRRIALKTSSEDYPPPPTESVRTGKWRRILFSDEAALDG